MRGDALASGDRSAVFTGPKLKIDEGQMRDDLLHLTKDQFIEKYRVAEREYDLINNTRDEEVISSFAEEMQQRAEMYNRQLAADASQEASLNRECFLQPFVPLGLTGRVIVTRDTPQTKAVKSSLLLPRSLRKEKEMLPTTGHVIKATIYDPDGKDISAPYIGLRVCFSPMSGTALCFNGYPTWIELELSEILATVLREDVQIVEETLEPMV